MATDTARVELELASGRNEITAPFHETAQRRRKQNEVIAASVDAPAAGPVFRTARPPWIAFIAALVAVAVGVWWVMSQRMPDIDPREVISRNLDAAKTAVADGRYTDPSERSAFHYYSAVLALDPENAEAIAGLDVIADRYLTNARVLLVEQKLADAGLALEEARRIRPEHKGLAALDTQWRAEVRKLLATSTVVAKTITEPVVKPATTKHKDAVSRPAVTARVARTLAAAPKIEKPPSQTGSAPDIRKEPVAQPRVANLAAAAVLAANSPSTHLDAMALPVTGPDVGVLNTGANIVEERAEPVTPEPALTAAGSAQPKLIKMVQPQYPQEALLRGFEGWVEVSLQVSPTGDVIEPRVEDSSRGRMFNRAALNAVQQWKYEPRADGATGERVRVRVQFKQAQ